MDAGGRRTGHPAWYRVKYAEPSIDWKIATIGCDRTLVGSEVEAEISCTIEGLDVETTYEIQLMSYRSVGGVWQGARYSNVASGATADADAIHAVGDLTTSEVGLTEMTRTWTQVNDGQGGPASYQLRYAQPPFDWSTAGIGCEIAGTRIGESASCTVDGLRAHWNEYSFQLVSFRDVNGT